MSKKIPLTSTGGLSSKDFKCKNHLEENQIEKLKSSFSRKYSKINVNIIFSNILANIGSKCIRRLAVNWHRFKVFLRTWTILPFLQSSGKAPSFKATSNIIFKDNANYSPHIFIIFIEILSHS